MKEDVDRDDELDFLKDTFIFDDCPPRLGDGVFKKYIPPRHDAYSEGAKEENQKDFEKVLNLPFIQDFSERVE